ncbi:MAG: hypothetical protein ACRDIV_20845 [Ktedonobacteraceae bacterium]
MSKQSANQRNKQRQGNNKSANNAAPSRPLTSVKPAQTASKANGTTATKPVEAKANGTTTAKPAQIATKSGSTGTPKPAQQGANAGTLKRAQQRRQQKTQNRFAQQRDDAKSRLATILTIAVVVVLAGSLITYLVIRNNAGTDNLAQAQQIVDPGYQPIDGVYCDTLEQSVEHIHAHLSIFMNGQQVPLVANTGIAPVGVTSSANVTCYYWLHTHDNTGVIHIESPTTRSYTLNQFFDIWERFSSSTSPFPTELSSSTGWVIYVNGKQVNTDFNHLQLHAHDLITLAYNSPGIKPDTTYAWQGL